MNSVHGCLGGLRDAGLCAPEVPPPALSFATTGDAGTGVTPACSPFTSVPASGAGVALPEAGCEDGLPPFAHASGFFALPLSSTDADPFALVVVPHGSWGVSFPEVDTDPCC